MDRRRGRRDRSALRSVDSCADRSRRDADGAVFLCGRFRDKPLLWVATNALPDAQVSRITRLEVLNRLPTMLSRLWGLLQPKAEQQAPAVAEKKMVLEQNENSK